MLGTKLRERLNHLSTKTGKITKALNVNLLFQRQATLSRSYVPINFRQKKKSIFQLTIPFMKPRQHNHKTD
jgi:hypothetical protein